MERRWQKVAARDGAVEARGEVGLGNLFSGVCLQAERSAGPRRSWSRRCWWIRREREGNAKANAKGTEKEREGHAKRKTRREREAEGNAKSREGNSSGGHDLTSARAACVRRTRSRSKKFARTRSAPGHMHDAARMLWRPRCGWGSEWNDTSPRRCLGIRGKLSIPRYTNTTHTDTHTH